MDFIPNSLRFFALLPLALVGIVSSAICQNLPDRIVVFDPLADTTVPRSGTNALTGTRLTAEFGRYSDGSGEQHRWNGKLGGYAEMVRWDSTWSIAIAGTLEVVMDPLNDIAFNPRAIFWEEGVMISRRAPWSDGAIIAGYMHRCKHDIDNHEATLTAERPEQRTLIYSGPFVRLLARPRPVTSSGSPVEVRLGASLRFDYFVHTLDDRWNNEALAGRPNAEELVAASNASVRLEVSPFGGSPAFHLQAGGMLTISDEEEMVVRGAVPFAELGVDLLGSGSSFTFFVRGEWQDDGGILTLPTPASLLLFGVRTSSLFGMW